MFADSLGASSSLDRSRRGWTTLCSFALQALGLTGLLALPMIYTEGLPELRLHDLLLTPPPAWSQAPRAPRNVVSRPITSNLVDGRFMAPSVVPLHTASLQDPGPPPEIPAGFAEGGVIQGLDDAQLANLKRGFSQVSPPTTLKPAPVQGRPFSRWMEGNLMHRVQPIYPRLAQTTGIQGTVSLRAVIGRDGTIQNVQVVSGHPMLVKAAVDAVAQWVYRPYYLNDQPVEVETQVTVNFVLAR
jgi:periplasmic protein TonB